MALKKTLEQIAAAAVSADMEVRGGKMSVQAIWRLTDIDAELVEIRMKELREKAVKPAIVRATWEEDNAETIRAAIAALPTPPEGMKIQVRLVKEGATGGSSSGSTGTRGPRSKDTILEVSGGKAPNTVLTDPQRYDTLPAAIAALLPNNKSANSYPRLRNLTNAGYTVTELPKAAAAQ